MTMKMERREVIKRLLFLLPVFLVTIGVFVFQDKLKQLEGWGIPGIFVLSLLASSTVIVPVPGFILACTMAPIFPPFWVAIASGLGAGLGEITGYVAGFSGQIVLEGNPRYFRLVDWMKKYGVWAILFFAFIPNPAFDIAGITAGTLKMPVGKFLVFCITGKIVRMMLISYACFSGLAWIQKLLLR